MFDPINVLNMIELSGDINWTVFTIQFVMAFTGCLCLALGALQAATDRRRVAAAAALLPADFASSSAFPVRGHCIDDRGAFPAPMPLRLRVEGITVRVPRMRVNEIHRSSSALHDRPRAA